MSNTPPILQVETLKKHFPIKRFMKPTATVKALDGVSFELGRQKTLAIVGESGCGKSTVAKVLMQIESATEGTIKIEGKSLSDWDPAAFRHQIQMIFQDPYSSINPRKRAWEIISEPLVINEKVSRAEAKAKALEMMAKVGLRPEFADRYPHMFSGGQRQRIGIARALILKPKILICDEPVSALDVSIQAQVINLLIDLQDQFGLSYIFISHDLSVVRHLADEIAVMYLGKIVEKGTREQVFSDPQHPYTRALLGSTPKLQGAHATKKKRVVIQGELPSPLNPPSGCTFHKRCPFATERCSTEVPALRPVQGRQVACHYAEEIEAKLEAGVGTSVPASV